MLPSKTIPKVNKKRHAHALKAKAKAKMSRAPLKNKAKDHSIEIEDTKDDNHPHDSTIGNKSFNTSIESITTFQFSHPKKVCSLLCCA